MLLKGSCHRGVFRHVPVSHKLSPHARVCRVPAPRRGLAVTCAVTSSTQLPANLKKIVTAFQMVPDPMARYKQLLYYATKLAPLPAEDHIPSNKVEGCVSMVWVKPELREDGCLYWQADSDSQLTKGLAALLVVGLSGCQPAEILSVDPAAFIESLGLKQSLTPSRNNGFLNMFKLMQRKSLALLAATEAAAAQAVPTSPEAASSPDERGPASTLGDPQPVASAAATAPAVPHGSVARSSSTSNGASTAAVSANGSKSASNGGGGSGSASQTPVEDGIRRNLTAGLDPQRLVIDNQSAQHAGHAHMMVAGKAGGSSETHFRLEVVSAAFEGLNQVKRHRLVYQLLQTELANGLHALSLDTKAPSEL